MGLILVTADNRTCRNSNQTSLERVELVIEGAAGVLERVSGASHIPLLSIPSGSAAAFMQSTSTDNVMGYRQ